MYRNSYYNFKVFKPFFWQKFLTLELVVYKELNGWLNERSNAKSQRSLTYITLIFYQIEPLKNGASLILNSSIARNS